MGKKGIFDRIIDSMAFLAGILLVAAVLIVCFEVCMRYFARSPQIWTMEVCEYILFIIAFLGAPWLLREGGHVSIDLILAQAGPRRQAYLGLFSAAVGVIVSGIIFWFSVKTSYECYDTGVVLVKTLSLPKHYLLIFIAWGYLFLLLEFARQFRNHWRSLMEEG